MISLVKKKTGLKRLGNEKFYTKSLIAKLCIDYFMEHVKPDIDDTIIEPSAGSGSFSLKLIEQFKNVYAYDIDPASAHILKQDFLKLSLKHFLKDGITNIHIIGNPPFGRQSSLARKFIKKSSDLATTISFILPKSFKKPCYQKSFPLNYHLLFQKDIPSNSFTINDSDIDVPCVFQIWKKSECDREKYKQPIPLFYSFVKKDNSPDIAIRRVGVYAGKIFKKTNDKNIQTHYFIKLNRPISLSVDKIVTIFSKNALFDVNNTVGARSISKGEVIVQLNKVPLLNL